LLVRYLGSSENPLSEQLLSRSRSEVAIIIRPVNLYTWDFTERMRDSIAGDTTKPCP
jgi:hypothetical protein